MAGLSRGQIESIVDKALAYKALQVKGELVWLIQKILGLPSRETAVELGTCNGGTLFALMHVFDRVFSIDVGRKDLPFPIRIGDEYIIGNTQNTEILKKVPDAVDFLLIDADHRYEGIKADFSLWRSKVRAGGMIALHDINGAVETDGVKKFWGEIIGDGSYQTDQIMLSPRFFGIGLIRI